MIDGLDAAFLIVLAWALVATFAAWKYRELARATGRTYRELASSTEKAIALMETRIDTWQGRMADCDKICTRLERDLKLCLDALKANGISVPDAVHPV